VVTLERKRDGWETRLRFGKGQRDRFLIAVDTDDAPVERETQLRQVADALARAEARSDRARETLTELAALADEAEFRRGIRATLAECEDRIKEIGPLRPARTSLDGRTTFGDVAELYFAEQLRKGNSLRTVEKDRFRLSVLAPKLARARVDQITTRLATEAMALVPSTVDASRPHFEGLIYRVLKHACRLELIDAVPLRDGFVSRQAAPKKLFQYLRVAEEAQLITYAETPLWRRLGCALMAREGVRPEFLSLFYWGDRIKSGEEQCSIDLESGLLTHKHKQKRVRRWTVCERVLRVLRAWRERHPTTDRVLPEWQHLHMSRTMRADLRAAGVLRPALHRTTATERQITAKDAGRATFVTLALRAGAPMNWVTDRSGHMSESMVARYNRMARELRDTERTWLRPLDELLGTELGLAPLDQPYVAPWLQGLGASELPTHDLGQQLGQLIAIARKNGLFSAPWASNTDSFP
jgi:hypothetical protein